MANLAYNLTRFVWHQGSELRPHDGEGGANRRRDAESANRINLNNQTEAITVISPRRTSAWPYRSARRRQFEVFNRSRPQKAGGIRGFDSGKKINGRKRHIVVDTIGLMVGLVVHTADIQDRNGAPAALKTILERWPWLRHVFADGGYAGPKLKGAIQKIGTFTLEIVKRTDKAKGFEVLPRRAH